MKIEVLFPELCCLFGDTGNTRYLQMCLPDAEFVHTAYEDEPLFVTEKPDLIYMGAMSEKNQERILKKLMPYKDRLAQLIEQDTPMLFTGNALELLGEYIKNEDGSKVRCLGIYHIYAKRDLMHRFNCLARGKYEGMDILGFKTQFTFCYGDVEKHPFFTVDKGTGMNKKTQTEGIHDHNLFGTYLVGPFLVINPYFTEYFMRKVMNIPDAQLACRDVMMAGWEKRYAEFLLEKTEY